MKRLSSIRIGTSASLILACLILLSGCGGIVSSRQITTISTIMDPIPANAYYFLPLVKIHLIAEGNKATAAEQKRFMEQMAKRAADPSGTTNSVATSETGCILTLKETLTEPDPRYMFSLSHLTNIFADDQVTITIAANGLLAHLKITSEGQAGQVLQKVVGLAGEIMKASVGLPTGDTIKRHKEEPFPFRYEAILDPTNAGEVETFNSYLKERSCNLLVEVKPPDPALVAANQNDPINAVRNGIYYRPALPYVITFKSNVGVSIKTAQTIYLPNAAPVLVFDIKRPSFVKFTQSIDFDNGMLKGSTIHKPSEALGFVGIPGDIVKSIVAIPSALFKFRVETIQGETGVLEAQRKLLDAQKQLLEKQAELRNAQEEAQKRQAGQAQP